MNPNFIRLDKVSLSIYQCSCRKKSYLFTGRIGFVDLVLKGKMIIRKTSVFENISPIEKSHRALYDDLSEQRRPLLFLPSSRMVIRRTKV